MGVVLIFMKKKDWNGVIEYLEEVKEWLEWFGVGKFYDLEECFSNFFLVYCYC